MSFADIDGLKMYYEVHGEGEETLILIAGLSGNTEEWGEQLPAFSERYRTVVFDNRGAGKSDKPDCEYSTSMFAGDLAGLMDELGIKRAHILGESMGGTIAQRFALDYPDMVKGLILSCTWGRVDNYLNQIFEIWTEKALKMGMGELMKEISLWIFTARFFETNLEDIKAGEEGFMDDPMPAYAFKRQSMACRAHDALNELGRITTPTLVLVGRDDILTPKHFADVIHGGIPGSRLEVLDGGHGFIAENAGKFNSAVLDFLSEVDRS